MTSVANKGGITVIRSGAFALNGQETIATFFGFDAVTGNFDLGKILKDVAFAGVSGAVTAKFNLDKDLQIEKGPSLLGATNGKFTFANIVDGIGDSAVTAGLTTAVYGGKLGDNFKSAFTSTVVNLAQADIQNLIGDRYNGENALVNGGEGSIGHVLEHAFAGCITGAALGGDCGASAVSAGLSAIYAGAADPERALRDERQAIALAELFGGFGAAVASGGDLNATMIGAGVAGSAFENNYLTHAEEEEFSRNLVACESQGSAAACERLNELRTLSDERDAQLQGCVGDYSGQCVRARWQLTQTAAEYYELGATGQSLGVLDERALLARHMVFLDAFAYADDLDANLRVDLGLLGPDYSSDAAQIIATGTQSEIEQAIIDPIALGVATFGGEFSPERRSGDNGTGANGGAGAANTKSVLRVTAANPSVSEFRAAEHMASIGHNVELRDPVGTRAGGGTSDLLVDGVPYDVYTPTSANPNRIISAIAKKNDQATGIVVDLSNSPVTREQLGDVLARVNGAGATNITDIVIIGK